MTPEMIATAPVDKLAAELINKSSMPNAQVIKGPSQKHILMAFEGLL